MSSVPTVAVGPSLNLNKQRFQDALWVLKKLTKTENKFDVED
jgi:hypothetical protein